LFVTFEVHHLESNRRIWGRVKAYVPMATLKPSKMRILNQARKEIWGDYYSPQYTLI
jgi:hypothetical protein